MLSRFVSTFWLLILPCLRQCGWSFLSYGVSLACGPSVMELKLLRTCSAAFATWLLLLRHQRCFATWSQVTDPVVWSQGNNYCITSFWRGWSLGSLCRTSGNLRRMRSHYVLFIWAKNWWRNMKAMKIDWIQDICIHTASVIETRAPESFATSTGCVPNVPFKGMWASTDGWFDICTFLWVVASALTAMAHLFHLFDM